MPINVLIIEDDLIIAENLLSLGYSVTGIATNFSDAVQLYKKSQPDVCITDIYLKGSPKNGIETMQYLQVGDQVPIIYLTSFTDHEIREKAKATNPSAYLLKPASQTQVDIAIDFALSNFRKKLLPQELQEENLHCPFLTKKGYFFIRVKDRYEKILTTDITFVKAAGSYTTIYSKENEYTVSAGMKSFLEQLDTKDIFRCHRSYAVNINKIHAFDDTSIYVMQGKEVHSLPVSNQYKYILQEILPKIKTD